MFQCGCRDSQIHFSDLELELLELLAATNRRLVEINDLNIGKQANGRGKAAISPS